jgi:hypothetical protein
MQQRTPSANDNLHIADECDQFKLLADRAIGIVQQPHT